MLGRLTRKYRPRTTLVVRIAVVAIACSRPAPSSNPAAASLRSYAVRRAAGPIRLDGRLDEPDWRAAEEVTLVDSLTGGPTRFATRVRLLWDEENLYAGFECQDDEPWARPGRRDDDPIYEDEVVELFLDPGGIGRDYSEIEVSPAGVRFDAQFSSWRSDLSRARSWSSGARSAVLLTGPFGRQAGRGWTVELAVPLERVRARLPSRGERWRFNLYRLESHNRAGVSQGSAFSPPLRGDFHALDRFGWLVFE